MFQYQKDIIKELSEEHDIDQEHVEFIWKYTFDKISGWLDDPKAPKILINGLMTLTPDIRFTERETIKYLHKLRNTKHEGLRKKYRDKINNLILIRRRKIKETKRKK